MFKNTLISFFVGIVVLISCKEKKQLVENKTFKVIHPIVKDTIYERAFPTKINSFMNVDIRSKIKGFIENIQVDEGKSVQQGQLLFSISSRELEHAKHKAEAALQSVEAELAGTEIEHENTRKLYVKNIVAKPELDLAETKVKLLKAKLAEAKVVLEEAELNLTYANVRAPFSGIINRIPNKKGSLVDEGALLTTLSNNENVFAYFNLSETEYLEYVESKNSSNKVALLLADNTKYALDGLIETSESEFDKSTGNIAFRARFANPKQILKEGSTGKVLVKTRLKNAILIPQKASFEIQGNIYIYIVNKDNKVNIKKINPLLRLPNFFVIDEGIQATDLVLYEGLQSVKEGDQINSQLVQIETNEN